VLTCIWDDNEAEIALLKLQFALNEQQNLQTEYVKLREQYRKTWPPRAGMEAASE